MLSIGIGFLILAAAHALGLRFLTKAAFLSSSEKSVLGTGLGLGVLALLVFYAGLMGFVNGLFYAILLALIFLISFPVLKTWPLILKKAGNWIASDLKGLASLLGIFSLAALLPAFMAVTAPELSGDSLCYHLYLPKVYLRQGAIPWAMPYEFNAYFPFLTEMLDLIGLALGGMTTARFLHFALGMLGAAAILVFSRSREKPWVSWAMAAIFLTTPGIINHLPVTYADIPLAAYTVLALGCLLRGLETSHRGYFGLCGIFCGFLLGVKYLALISIAGFGFLLLFNALFEKKWRLLPERLLALGAPALLVGGIWYVRAYANTGNPFFPYLAEIFGNGNKQLSYHLIGIPLNSVWAFFQIPWFMTLHPGEAPASGGIGFSGMGEQIGPAYLALLPFAVFAGREKRAWLLGIWIFISFIGWALLGQVLRFFFPVLPALGLLTALGLRRAPLGKKTSHLLMALLALFLLIHAAFSTYFHRKTFRHFAGHESTEDYLKRHERTYSPALYLNRALGAGVKILIYDETHLFYFDFPLLREDSYYQITRYADSIKEPEQVIEHFKALGFTHFLLAEEPGLELPPSLRLPSLVQHQEKRLAGRLLPIYNSTVESKEAPSRKFTLYQLN